MQYLIFIIAICFWLGGYAVGRLPQPETFTVVMERDCYIEHDGVEMKLITVDDLKDKLDIDYPVK